MKEIKVDLFDALKQDNDSFFQLLDAAQWERLKAKYADPSNTKSIEGLVFELMEGR